MKKSALFSTQIPSTDFSETIQLNQGAGYYDIQYQYANDKKNYVGILRFHKVSAYSRRMEICCTLWHIKDLYDTLVEVCDSEWAAEIKESTKKHLRDDREYHHYMIYLDSSGCFEFVASSCEMIEEVQDEERVK